MPADPYPHGLASLSGATLEATLQRRLGGAFSVGALSAAGSAFIKPATISYELDGRARRWDVIEAHESVGIVLYHEDLDAFVLVRQFRPAVYATLLLAGGAGAAAASSSPSPPPPMHAGFTFELCAGLCDKAGKPAAEIAAEEILEECGFVVDAKDVRPLTSSVSSAGTAGALHHLFFARVSDAARAPGGGGGLADTGEAIEVLALPFDRVDGLVMDGGAGRLMMSPGLQFGLVWAARELGAGRLGGRRRRRQEGGGGGGGGEDDGLLTAELNLKPVLPA
jgi:nudix-type nucleoside diphosphatase (YffH/AdpP family)